MFHIPGADQMLWQNNPKHPLAQLDLAPQNPNLPPSPRDFSGIRRHGAARRPRCAEWPVLLLQDKRRGCEDPPKPDSRLPPAHTCRRSIWCSSINGSVLRTQPTSHAAAPCQPHNQESREQQCWTAAGTPLHTAGHRHSRSLQRARKQPPAFASFQTQLHHALARCCGAAARLPAQGTPGFLQSGSHQTVLDIEEHNLTAARAAASEVLCVQPSHAAAHLSLRQPAHCRSRLRYQPGGRKGEVSSNETQSHSSHAQHPPHPPYGTVASPGL